MGSFMTKDLPGLPLEVIKKNLMIAQPFLPLEVVEKVVAFLPLSDVCNCMLVCKEWKELLSSELFCKNYVLSHYDFNDEEEPSGHLLTWSSPDNWTWYWNENADCSNVYVFSDPPKRWKCGIIHLANYTLGSDKELKYKHLLKAVYILARIQTAAHKLALDCWAFGNEGGGFVETCLFPWNKETLPTAEDVIALFHFNPEMHRYPMVNEEIEKRDYYEDGHPSWNTITSYSDDVKEAETFFNWLEKLFFPMIQIGIGCERMNPVPCFILAKLAPGWVGDVLTSLCCT
ncbi:uncharacterized protein LOC144632041 [Oculina patagonica]